MGFTKPPNAGSYTEHINEELQANFPLGDQIPIPADLATDLRFNIGNSREAIAEFRPSQLEESSVIASECQKENGGRYRYAPDAILPDTGRIHIALLVHLTRYTLMNGTNWLMQFVIGFPITDPYIRRVYFLPIFRAQVKQGAPECYSRLTPLVSERGPLEPTPAHPMIYGAKLRNMSRKDG